MAAHYRSISRIVSPDTWTALSRINDADFLTWCMSVSRQIRPNAFLKHPRGPRPETPTSQKVQRKTLPPLLNPKTPQRRKTKPLKGMVASNQCGGATRGRRIGFRNILSLRDPGCEQPRPPEGSVQQLAPLRRAGQQAAGQFITTPGLVEQGDALGEVMLGLGVRRLGDDGDCAIRGQAPRAPVQTRRRASTEKDSQRNPDGPTTAKSDPASGRPSLDRVCFVNPQAQSATPSTHGFTEIRFRIAVRRDRWRNAACRPRNFQG